MPKDRGACGVCYSDGKHLVDRLLIAAAPRTQGWREARRRQGDVEREAERFVRAGDGY